MSEQSFNSTQEDEISLRDMIDFLVESWKIIVITGILGLFSSVAYLLITPNQYQATAQIQMAQISANINNNNNNNNNTSPLGINIEEPSLLIARFKLPSNYSTQEIVACDFESSKSPFEDLATAAKFSVVKGVESIIELKITRDSKEIAITCAQSLFENIRISQNKIINPYIEEAKTLLVKYQDRLANSQSMVSRADKSGAALSAAYLASRDEVKFLTDEILRLNAFIVGADSKKAKLVSPIYASDDPVFPKKTISLIVGLMIGLFFGLLLAYGKRSYKVYKASSSLQQ
jgi:hypothetical protein